MKLIVGLGNPGTQYSGTRHNAGRLLAETIAADEGLKWGREKKLRSTLARTRWKTEEIILALPETFMNLSGEAVALLAAHTGIDVSRDLLIALDDIALPFGRLRLREKGTDGGHNGLKSISGALATTVYARLRIGIAPPESSPSGDLAAYVLESFTRQEKKALGPVLEKGREACRLWALESPAAAMNVVNPYNC